MYKLLKHHKPSPVTVLAIALMSICGMVLLALLLAGDFTGAAVAVIVLAGIALAGARG